MSVKDIPLFNLLPFEVQDFIGRMLLLLLVLIMIFLLRRVVLRIAARPVQRMARHIPVLRDERILELLAVPVRYFIIAVALFISAEILEVGGRVNIFVSNLGRSFIILGILMTLYRLPDIFMPTATQLFAITGMTIEDRLIPFLRTAIKLLIISMGLVILLQEWDYDVSGLIAGLGLGGLALSLAAQDTVSNLFGFMAIVSDRPFNVGEFVVTPDAEGIVEHVGLRTTRIRRLDQGVIYVPNRKMADAAVLNWSRLSKRRMDYVLGVTYSSTSEDLRVLLHRTREMLRSQPLVDPDSVVVYFTGFGDSSLNILIRSFVHLSDWGEFHAEQERLHLLVMDIIRDLGMSVAFPSRSLYLEAVPDRMTLDPLPPIRRDQLDEGDQILLSGQLEDNPPRIAQADDPDSAYDQQDMPSDDDDKPTD